MMIDLYCERQFVGLFDEPFNLLSNLSFIIAGAVTLHLWRRADHRYVGDLLLVINLFALGIGSSLFHSFATRWSLIIDVIPIQIAIILYFFLLFWRVLSLSIGYAALLTLTIVLGSVVVAEILPEGFLNGSGPYLVPILSIGLSGLILGLKNRAASGMLIADPFARSQLYACVLLLLSVGARSLDHAACELTAGIGLHLFWHLFNGWALGILVAAMIRHTNKIKPRPA